VAAAAAAAAAADRDWSWGNVQQFAGFART